MSRSRRAALVLVLGVAAAACGSSSARDGSGSSSTTARSADPSFAGTTWVLQDPAPGDVETSVTARFDGRELSGTGGCNAYRTTYTRRGARLEIAPQIATTAMTCGAAADAVERSYLAALPKVRTQVVEEGVLTLSGEDGAPRLRFRATAGSDALAGEWEVTGFATGSAVVSVAGDARLTARFVDGALTGNGGCNSFHSTYEATADTISIAPIASTMMACADPERSTQEQQYLAALEQAERYSVRGDQLQLLRADGTIAVTFDRG
jgi:heat shock protein HslJ